jgi:hypothetical protein
MKNYNMGITWKDLSVYSILTRFSICIFIIFSKIGKDLFSSRKEKGIDSTIGDKRYSHIII